jgi:hypothetical protein
MKKEVDKANEMVKQVATEKEKKAKVCLVYGVLDSWWWAKYDVVSAPPPPHQKQLSDTHLFICS